MDKYGWMFLVMLTFIFLKDVASIGWLTVAHSKDHVWEKPAYCSRNKIKGFNKDQRFICRKNLDLMLTVVKSARLTMDVCQELFSERRWNCSSLLQVPQLLPDLTGGSREQAFVFALSAAILSQSVAKACSSGYSSKCGCGQEPSTLLAPADFKWGGCGDDVNFGILFSKWFTNSPWSKQKDSKNHMINIHNSEVGRKMTADSLAATCKCHGVSGSCSLKTCWLALPEPRLLGANLQKKYFTALEVDLKTNRKTRERRLVSVLPTRKSIAEDELIYCTISPDYCLPDKALGSIGTKGRLECKKDHNGPSGCKSMCCGRGFTTELIQVKQRCNCKYYWCCYVKCNTCIKKVEVYKCR